MTKTAQRTELALDDLDAVIGGSTSPMAYFHPVAIMSSGMIPGAATSTAVTPSAANNYGLANHFNLGFPAMASDSAHPADGIAPGIPGQIGAPGPLSAATHIDPTGTGQDAHPASGWTGPGGIVDDHGAQVAALPFSLVPVPGEFNASAPSATAATAAAPAPADAGTAMFLGLPGGTDMTAGSHGDPSHATNDWAPGSLAEIPAAATDSNTSAADSNTSASW